MLYYTEAVGKFIQAASSSSHVRVLCIKVMFPPSTCGATSVGADACCVIERRALSLRSQEYERQRYTFKIQQGDLAMP